MPPSFMLDETSSLTHVEWFRFENSRFSVYADRRAEPLARYGLQALEEAYPAFSELLGVHLHGQPPLFPKPEESLESPFSKIPVVINTATTVGGFANPFTQNLELKISRGSQKSLFQHELAHRIMYEHLDLGIGAGGRAFTLTMTPAWWLEGLAEHLTESVGYSLTRGIARSMALHGRYLSWNRLHSLYQISSYDLFLRGYVTSGQFFRYLLESPETPDLYGIHRDLLKWVLIPPFVTAADFFFWGNFEKTGHAVYQDFMEAEKLKWEKRTKGVPSVWEQNLGKTLYTSEATPYVNIVKNGSVSSNLFTKVFPSALLAKKEGEAERLRFPVGIKGGAFFRTYESESGSGITAWSLTNERNEKGIREHTLQRFELPDGFPDQKEVSLQGHDFKLRSFGLKTAFPDHQVIDLAALDSDRALLLLNDQGTTKLVLFQASTQSMALRKTWQVPNEVSFLPAVPGRARNCARVLLDADEHVTSIEEHCWKEGSEKVLLPPRQFTVLGASDMHDGRLLLTVAWKDLVGVVIHDPSGLRSETLGVVKEWIAAPQPSYEPGKPFFWFHDGDEYRFQKMDLAQLKESFERAREVGEWSEDLRELPAWSEYVPPFELLLAEKRRSAGSLGSNSGEDKRNKDSSESVEVKSSESPAKWSEARYRSRHWFTYPLPDPTPLFGGPALYLFSVPFIDEMERYQVSLITDYNFVTEKANLTLSFLSRRVGEGLGVSVFSRERFNGLYSIYNCAVEGEPLLCVNPEPVAGASRRFHFLRESGAQVSTELRFKPTSLRLTTAAEVAALRPSLGSRSAVLGAQEATLLSLSAGLAFTIFETAFYLGNSSRDQGHHLLLNSTMTLSAEENLSLGEVRDGLGQETSSGQLHFQNLSLSVGQVSQYRSNKLSLGADLGTTLGEHTLNRKQVYTPYRTFLSGSASSLNKLNFPVWGERRLFGYSAGDWRYRLSAEFSRPLISELDWRLTIIFFESLDAEVAFGRGGVANEDDLSDATVVDSVSAAVRLNMDIKGFRVFPAVAYGQLLGDSQGDVFVELSFSEFF